MSSYYYKNRDKILKYQKEYYEKNKQLILEKQRVYFKQYYQDKKTSKKKYNKVKKNIIEIEKKPVSFIVSFD